MAGLISALLRRGGEEDVEQLREKLRALRDLVEKNDRVLELIADAGEMLGGEYIFDSKYLDDLVRELKTAVHEVVANLNTITRNRYPQLFETVAAIDTRVEADLECRVVVPDQLLVIRPASSLYQLWSVSAQTVRSSSAWSFALKAACTSGRRSR